MIRTVALLGLVASASAFLGLFEDKEKDWYAGLRAKFDINPVFFGTKSFFGLPRSSAEAQKKGWHNETRPTRSNKSGFDSLDLWVNPKNYDLSILVDENGHTSGVQIAISADGFTPYYDLEQQGLVPWTYTNADGVEIKSWTTCIFFASEDKETRSATFDKNKVLQTSKVVVDGPNGKPYEIATVLSEIDSIWTRQACLPLMGLHFYHNMTTSLSCDSPIFTWFPLYHEKTGQLIGLGFMIFSEDHKLHSNTMEEPSEAAVKMIVPTAPACMLEMVKTHGVRTIHVYFIDSPWLITC